MINQTQQEQMTKQKLINKYLKGGKINLYELKEGLKKIGYSSDEEIEDIIKKEVISLK